MSQCSLREIQIHLRNLFIYVHTTSFEQLIGLVCKYKGQSIKLITEY